MIKFTEATAQAIDTVGQQCAADMESYSDPEIMAETVLDAQRLTTFGYPWAQFEVHLWIQMYGYRAVLKEAAGITRYA
jgi:hypothetical protein